MGFELVNSQIYFPFPPLLWQGAVLLRGKAQTRNNEWAVQATVTRENLRASSDGGSFDFQGQ